MTCLVKCMPTGLELFKDKELHLYETMCLFKFHFHFSLVIDFLHELNKLNIKFQHDMVDVTTIRASINLTMSILSRQSRNGPTFGRTSKNLGKF